VNRELERLHDLVIVWLLVIIVTVLIVRYGVFFSKTVTIMTIDSLALEIIWTIIPIFILVGIAVPRIHLLCLQDTLFRTPNATIKILSNQWNWQREQREQIDHLLDSDKLDELRSYEYPLIISLGDANRILLTRTDVLHSLGVPSLGVKLDSTPGRLNAVTFELLNSGLLTGSCYELCGSGHRAIPIYLLSI